MITTRRLEVPVAAPSVALDSLAVVILAAGRGVRFGGHKLVAEYRGEPLIGHVLEVARTLAAEGVVGPAVAVVPEGDAALQELAHVRGCRVVRQEDPTRGKQDSLRLGLAAVLGHPAALILLGDQPLVSPAVIRTLVAEWRSHPAAIVRPRYQDDPDTPGHPVIAPARWWWLADSGEPGLAHAALAGAAVRWVPVPGRNPDVDTVADLHALNNA